MNSKIIKLMLFFYFVASLIFHAYGQGAQTRADALNQILVLDNFDKKPSGINFSSFHGETAINSLGYCIYYENAEVNLSKIVVSEGDSALRIEFNLPTDLYGGNWLSIRNEQGILWNLSKYKGLELKLKVETPSNAMLRLTLADVVSTGDVGKKGADELWWYGFHESVMKIKPGKWQTLKVPFKKFYESWGTGTRYNDGKLNLSKIVAFEINLISNDSFSTKGTIVVNSLAAYK